MKKAFVAILSLAALVACSQDVTLQRNDSAAISFDNFIEKKTRVAADPSTTTESLSEFSVWGFRGESSALVLQEERVYKTAEGWVYDNLQYWNEGADYFFAAVSPVKHSQVEVDATGLCKTGLGTITFTNTAAGDVDLIYASKLIDKSNVNASNPEKVKLQFAHLLAKVKFSIAYDFPNALTTVAVKDLKIANSPAVGTIDLTNERANWLWTLPQTGETVTLEFGDIEKGAQFPLVNEYYESDKECLLIPADATRSYTITFMVEVYNNGVLAGEYPKTVTLTDKAFVQGKNYNIKTVITPDNIVDGGLKPIEFEVIEVEPWVDGDAEPELPAEPTVLATPAVKTSVDVNVVTLTWNKVEGAAYYTVQVDDDIAEKVEGTSYVFEGDYAVEYMFTVVAVPAEGENLVASEAAVVTATTEAKPEEPVTPEPTETVLYLQPNANWNVDNARFAAYMWNDAGDTWFDLTLVEGEENIYEFTLPEGYSNLIFCRMNPSATANNWDNKWNQTNDLTVPTDGTNLYTIAEGAWDKGAGTWSTYTPATEEPVEPETPAVVYTTVAEFLAAAEDDTIYTLKGTITSVTETSYGNFYLNDGTGEVLIYGLCSPEGATKYWAASGAKVGDDIVVKTVRTSYSNVPQGKNAIFVELITPGTLAFWSFEATSASFTAAADAKDIEVTIYNSTADVVATSDNAQFSATYANGVLTVSALENTSSDLIEGNITVTCGTLTQIITVSQLGASSGAQTAVEATISFADKANRTTYTTSQQVWEQNGITVTNDKASSTTNVGDYANPGRFYKGSNVKIEAPGAIVSISINVSGLDSKYVTPWGTASNGIVTITLDGTSNTYQFTNLSAQARANSMTITYLE